MVHSPVGLKLTCVCKNLTRKAINIKIFATEPGEALGREKGKVEGLAEGEAKSLVRLLVKRFGPLPDPVIEQIAAGCIEDLDRWFDAAITASSVEAVFGKRRDH